MSSSADSSSASPVKRTARLKKHGNKYTLLLLINGESVETRITESPQDQTFDKGLEWRDDDGFTIPGATYSMVTKGSSLVFEGNEYLVEKETPFDLQPPAYGEKCFRFGFSFMLNLFKSSFANN